MKNNINIDDLFYDPYKSKLNRLKKEVNFIYRIIFIHIILNIIFITLFLIDRIFVITT